MLDPYPYADYESTLRTKATQDLLLQADREQIILLENRAKALPLSKSIGSVALIGPSAGVVQVRSPLSSHISFST